MRKNTLNTNNNILRKARIIALGLVVCLLCVFFMTGCTTYDNFKVAFLGGDPEVKEATIKIGVYEPMSGGYKQFGKDETAGIELAHSLYPTVLGKTVELIYADNRSNMYDAETALQELMSKGPSIVLGSYGEVLSLVAADYMIANNTPAITITSTNPLITANNDFYFTASFSSARQGSALAEYAIDAMNKTTFATIKIISDDSATATVKRFRSKVTKKIGSDEAIKGAYEIKSDALDYSTYIEKLMNNGVDALLLAVPPSVAQVFMDQCCQMEYYPLFLGTRDWDTDDFAKYVMSNPDLSVSYPSVQAAETTDTYQIFMDAYTAKYGNASQPSGGMAAAFDAYLLAIKAIEDAYENVKDIDIEELKSDTEADAKTKAEIQSYETTLETGIPSGIQIRDALKDIDDFEGATGVLSYDGSTEVSKNVTIIHFFMGERLAPYSIG
ncbi:MAG: ABC transporter substrate-binding protein [Firmicutes bacterium]|nr:ABC transporter substrate-binding protein [Bacillota bacterium]